VLHGLGARGVRSMEVSLDRAVNGLLVGGHARPAPPDEGGGAGREAAPDASEAAPDASEAAGREARRAAPRDAALRRPRLTSVPSAPAAASGDGAAARRESAGERGAEGGVRA
jgi:hypothetical protein